MPLVALDRVSMAFGHLPLLDEVALQVEPRERVCLIGRNGTGKSVLLKILSGELLPDSARCGVSPACASPVSTRTCRFRLISRSSTWWLRAWATSAILVMAYHRAAVAVAEAATGPALKTLGRLQHELEERDAARARVELSSPG